MTDHDLATVSREAVVANVTLFWTKRPRQPLVRSDSLAAGIEISDLQGKNTAELQVSYVQKVSINKARNNACGDSDHVTVIHVVLCNTFHFLSRYQSQRDNRFTERRKVSICGAGVNRVVGDLTGIAREVGTCSGGRQ